MKIVFMGTPSFAVPTLKRLVEDGHDIRLVVTLPDRKRGRGRKASATPVKLAAQELGLPLYATDNFSDRHFRNRLRESGGELFIVVGFRKLPQSVFTLPARGTVNLHASLLPRYRGAAPIQWAIIKGEQETGVTTFFINTRIDRGDILLRKKTAIARYETAGELHDRLARLGAECVSETVAGLEQKTLSARSQEGEACKAPKLRPEHTYIDWNSDAEEVVNLIHGLSPYPGCCARWKGKRIKFYRARPSHLSQNQKPGTVVRAEKDSLVIQAGNGAVEMKEIQMPGKRKMETADFLRGSSISAGDVLESCE